MGTPVSGPGQFSQRTDKAVSEANRSLPNAGYGEQAQYQEQMSGADIGGAAVAPSFSDFFGDPSAGVVGFDADSTMPDTPVTDGAALGAGAGPEILSSTQGTANNYMASYMPLLEYIASRPGSSDAARNLVRKMKASL
jgi:hypothetical protein